MNYDVINQNNNNAMALYSTIFKEIVYHTQKLFVILKGWVCANYLGLVVLASVILLFRLKYVLIHPMLSFGLCLSCLILSLEIMLVKLRDLFSLIIIHFLKGAVFILYYCRYLLLLLFPVCLNVWRSVFYPLQHEAYICMQASLMSIALSAITSF